MVSIGVLIKGGLFELHTNNADNLSVGETISYEQFLFFLRQGREVEFNYCGKEYFISNTRKGRTFWTGQTKICELNDKQPTKILTYINIDGKTLKDLVEQNEIRIITIY